MREFNEFFEAVTGNAPFPFQRRFALADRIPQFVGVPTGLGKTAMVVVGWLWRRFHAGGDLRAATPRRLVYCLPTRVLVEQTRECALEWLAASDLLAGNVERTPSDGHTCGRIRPETYRWDPTALDRVGVHVLMGGEAAEAWDLYPEREAILVGTQDMLLSRALNRGYALSRSRWPMQFGSLHTDCLWVFDEIQLMGAGLATTAQLEAFRRILPSRKSESAAGHRCRSVWMSATLRKDWLETVDFKPFLPAAPELTFEWDEEINASGLDERTRQGLESRWNAKKVVAKASATIGDPTKLAFEVLEAHRAACAAAGKGTRTIVVANTVQRARELFDALNVLSDRGPQEGRKSRDLRTDTASPMAHQPVILLLHSRFRPGDRRQKVEAALAEIKVDAPGTIVVSTQVIEAGVDVSATTLFTELAPWASLVQRFGRCNRGGEVAAASIFWVDLPDKRASAEKMAPPYGIDDLNASRKLLETLPDAALKSLPAVKLDFEHAQVIRRKDLIDLFDTTPDLAGADIDIDRFVREVDQSDVRVFWRAWDRSNEHEPPPDDEPAPRHDELCPVPIGSDKHGGFRQFIKKQRGRAWRWSFPNSNWERVRADMIVPGQVFLVHADAGGYSPERGWDLASRDRVGPVPPPAGRKGEAPDTTGAEPLSRADAWQTIREHTDEVCRELDIILTSLPHNDDDGRALRLAARWHDRGKAHAVFQNAIDDGQVEERRARPHDRAGCRVVAKAPGRRWEDGQLVDRGFWRRYDWPEGGRRHFRHELASALAVLLAPDALIAATQRDLVAYLVAAHHGKVRLSIRSLPNESRPDDGRRFARGIWDGDELPRTDLGRGVAAPAVELSLEPMELGLGETHPFLGQPSWVERMLQLRDTLGPFRLAWLEAVLRAADWRASRRQGAQ